MSDWIWIAMCVLFVIIGPLIGCILAGIDRKISARMQNRVGPPILQPLYDVKKFLAKEQVTPNKVQDFYVMVFLLFTIVTGAMFFAGMDPSSSRRTRPDRRTRRSGPRGSSTSPWPSSRSSC